MSPFPHYQDGPPVAPSLEQEQEQGGFSNPSGDQGDRYCIEDLEVDESADPDDFDDADKGRVFTTQPFFSAPSYVISGAGHASENPDFISLISAISKIYRTGRYLPMRSLDNILWKPLGRGATFRVSASTLKLWVGSTRDQRNKILVSNNVVIKRNDTPGSAMERSQLQSFISELRVLDILHGHPSIVELRGIGWFYNEFIDDTYNSPKPVLMLEEAFGVLDYLVGPDVALEFDNMFSIFAQITSGLSALHECRVAHGDVKPGNILLFQKAVYREGARVESYAVKLSDFGSSVFDTKSLQYFPSGTRGYAAPEIGDSNSLASRKVSFEEIIYTDIWSLGMLFAVVACNSQGILNETARIEDLSSRVKHVLSQAKRRIENSTLDPAKASVLPGILRHTLRTKPNRRNLDIVDNILAEFRTEPNRTNLNHPSSMNSWAAADELIVSYESLKNVSGSVKEMIVNGLEALADTNDPRRPKALWELGIIHLSGFASQDTPVQRGIGYVRQAGEAGSIQAKALYRQLHQAFLPQERFDLSQTLVERWLEEAAIAGHQAAIAELQNLAPGKARASQAISAAACFKKLQRDVSPQDKPLPAEFESLDMPLHQAAASGQLDHALLEKLITKVNSRNAEGDTPLISACRFGQFPALMLLLSKGADASLCNHFGENALHFAWCFGQSEAEIVVRELVKASADLKKIAKGRPNTLDLDILPVLPGTPLERTAGRHRLDLVLVFLSLENPLITPNGNLSRRIIMWAFRLHDVALQGYLLDYIFNNTSEFDPRLAPLEKTTWLHRGEERTLLDAVCAGWISGAGFGCDIPYRIWLASCNGIDWWASLQTSLMHVLDMRGNSLMSKERLIDRSISWTFRESHYDSFMALLHIKVEQTPGLRSRLPSFELLEWKLNTENVCTIPCQTAQYVDQVFYCKKSGTLAQQAMMAGDRLMFRILTRKYGANVALPTPKPSDPEGYHLVTERSVLHQCNMYSYLAYSDHKDLWFATELQRLGLPLTCPWNTMPYQDFGENRESQREVYLYSPPVLHALGTHFWAYALWLLRSGASLEESVTCTHNVMDAVMATHSLEIISFIFRGCFDRQKGAAFLPNHYCEAGGYFVCRLFLQNSRTMYESGVITGLGLSCQHPDIKSHKREVMLSCYEYLLKTYANVENAPFKSFSLYGLVPHVYPSLLRYSAELSKRSRSDLSSLIISKSEGDLLSLTISALSARPRGFPKQQLTAFVYQSPLDPFEINYMVDRLSSTGLTLRELCPSVTYFRFLVLWMTPSALLSASLILRWIFGREDWTGLLRPASSVVVIPAVGAVAFFSFPSLCHCLELLLSPTIRSQARSWPYVMLAITVVLPFAMGIMGFVECILIIFKTEGGLLGPLSEAFRRILMGHLAGDDDH